MNKAYRYRLYPDKEQSELINNELTLAVWTRSCGTVHDRDINVAINIKNEGCRMLKIA